MKRVIITVIMLALAVGFIVYHNTVVSKLDERVDRTYDTVMSAFEREDYEKITAELESLEEEWDDAQSWIGMTLDTDMLEEIGISLRQSIEYAKIAAKEDFIGEFVMFNQCVKHLTYYERLSIESLL